MILKEEKALKNSVSKKNIERTFHSQFFKKNVVFTQFISFLNKPIKPPLLNQGYHKHIEQYRGLCALLVLINHGTVHEEILVNNFKWPGVVHYLGAGYLSVIIFFCISGYVIGISNDHEKLNVKLYLKKRLVRLYPIYLFAIIFCIILAGGVSWLVVTGNLLFLQNTYGHFNIPIFINFPIWSLNYEALYYLLFIPLFFIHPKVWHLTFGMLLLSVLLIHCNQDLVFFANYVCGYYFWIMGLLIGWKIIDGKNKTSAVPLLSLLFLHLCQHHLGLGEIILHVLKINSITGINWLFDIPFCLMIMSILVQKESAFFRFNKVLCYTLPAIVFIYLILTHRIFEDIRWIMCLIFWLLSLIFYIEKRISAFLLDKLTVVGKISYALYLLHAPVALLIKKTVFINNQPVEIVVKYFLWLSITFSLATLLELYCQPAIRKLFIRR